MTEKTGRERQFNFRDASFGAAGDQWMFGMLLELGERVFDQVEHLPAGALHSAPAGSYLTPARVVVHLVGNDLKMFRFLTGPFDAPDYAGEVQQTAAADLLAMETKQLDPIAILDRHLVFRRQLVTERCRQPGLLDEACDHPACATKRDVLGHMIWHWAFHGGHIGAVTLELGYEYLWTSAKKV